MQVKVDSGVCAGHGRCWAVAPQVYSADDDGFAEPQDELIKVSDSDTEQASRGARSCPEGAIQIIEA